METAPLSSASPGRSPVALCILIIPACTTISCSFDKRDRAGLARAFYSSSFAIVSQSTACSRGAATRI